MQVRGLLGLGQWPQIEPIGNEPDQQNPSRSEI
jgi:hypothetical protein